MIYFLEIDNIEQLPDNLSDYPISGLVSAKKFETELDLLVIDGDSIFKNDEMVGSYFEIMSAEDMQRLMDTDFNNLKYIMIKTGDWHVIPLENLIAKLNTINTKLIVSANNPEHISLLRNILELGVDICMIQLSDAFKLDDFAEKMIERGNSLDLMEAEVVHVERIGIGDRVCVDTVTLLKDGEGIMVGSTAKVMVLVQAEVAESGFVNSRPFRINAGVVASYTLFDEKTRYLSEIKAGSQVMIVDRDGNTRKEYVARVKIEKRPLYLLRVKYDDNEYPVLLQDAETVRLMTKDSSIRIDQLEIATKILVNVNNSARHFGMAVDEFIEER